MAMPVDLFQPSPAETAENPASAAAEWTQVLQDPKVRASMLSMGLQLMQPPSFGQTTSGQFAQAIGAGGETIGRQEEMDRAEQEQARRERDTASQIDYRADRSEVQTGLLREQQQRTITQQLEAESRDRLRVAQAATALANVERLQAQAEALRMKTELFPQDQNAKIELAKARQKVLEAQAGLAAARTEAVAPVAASTVRRNEAAATLSEKRGEQAGANVDLGRRRVEAMEKRTEAQTGWQGVRAENQRRRDYITEKKAHDEQQSMNLPRLRTAFPPYQQWLKKFEEQPQTPASSATAPAPAAPAAPVNVADETAKAQRAIATAKSEATKAAIRALYKQRTGQDLP